MYALDFLYVYALFKFMFLIFVVENPIATRVRVSCIGGLLCATNSGRTRKRSTRVSTASGALLSCREAAWTPGATSGSPLWPISSPFPKNPKKEKSFGVPPSLHGGNLQKRKGIS